MPAGYDAEVAELFRDLRAASGMSEAELAAQLATRVEVVQALEHGALYALPAWPETCRVVSTYGTVLNLDVRPLLRRIYAQIDAGIVELEPKSAPDVPSMTPQDDMTRDHHQPARAPQQPQPQRMAPQPSPSRQPGPPPQRQPSAPERAQAPQGMPAHGQPPRMQPPQQGQPRPQGGPQPVRQPAAAHTPPPQRVQPGVPRALPGPGPATPLGADALAGHAVNQPAAGAKPARKAWFRSPLLKWGVAALVLAGLLFGAWSWFTKPGHLVSPGGPTAQKPVVTTDPNDPRSRKADRLPGPS